MKTSVLQGLRDLAHETEVLFCDVWGVLHNGVRAYPDAVEALLRFRQGGGCVILVSNAPRPAEPVRQLLEALSIMGDAYDSLITSGDIARTFIKDRRGVPLYHLGPERDLPLFSHLEAPRVALEEAAYVVCTGLFDDETETVESYESSLDQMRERNLPFLCANPDIMVERDGRLLLCAGAIAAAYEKKGGDAVYTGKPHSLIYQTALAHASSVQGQSVDPDRVLAIGDALHTDIAGAKRFGLKSLFIARGIHAEEIYPSQPSASGTRDSRFADNPRTGAERAAVWLEAQDTVCDRVMERLSW